MRRVARQLLFAASCALFFGLPRVSWACPACVSPTEDANRLAFILTTVVLSLLPLVIVGAFAWWLRRRSRQLNAAPAQAPRSESPAKA